MASHIDEKVIFPGAALGGAAFDLGHVDFEFLKRFESTMQRAGLVPHGEHYRSAILPGGRAGLVADDKKASRVGRDILDGGFQHVEVVKLSQQCAA